MWENFRKKPFEAFQFDKPCKKHFYGFSIILKECYR